MAGGAQTLMVGAVVSTTVKLVVQVLELPAASITPGSTFGIGASHVASAEFVVAAGQLTVGGVVSTTVKVVAQVLVLPAASTTYSVTGVVPKPTVLPMAGLCVISRALAAVQL